MHVDNTIFYEKQPYHTVDIAARPPIQSANISIRPMGGLVRPLMVDMNSITSNASSKVIQNPSELSISQQDSVAVRERHIIPASRTPAPTPDAMSRFRATSKLLFTPTGRRQSSTTTHQSSLLLTKPRTAAVHQPDSTVAIKISNTLVRTSQTVINPRFSDSLDIPSCSLHRHKVRKVATLTAPTEFRHHSIHKKPNSVKSKKPCVENLDSTILLTQPTACSNPTVQPIATHPKSLVVTKPDPAKLEYFQSLLRDHQQTRHTFTLPSHHVKNKSLAKPSSVAAHDSSAAKKQNLFSSGIHNENIKENISSTLHNHPSLAVTQKNIDRSAEIRDYIKAKRRKEMEKTEQAALKEKERQESIASKLKRLDTVRMKQRQTISKRTDKTLVFQSAAYQNSQNTENDTGHSNKLGLVSKAVSDEKSSEKDEFDKPLPCMDNHLFTALKSDTPPKNPVFDTISSAVKLIEHSEKQVISPDNLGSIVLPNTQLPLPTLPLTPPVAQPASSSSIAHLSDGITFTQQTSLRQTLPTSSLQLEPHSQVDPSQILVMQQLIQNMEALQDRIQQQINQSRMADLHSYDSTSESASFISQPIVSTCVTSTIDSAHILDEIVIAAKSSPIKDTAKDLSSTIKAAKPVVDNGANFVGVESLAAYSRQSLNRIRRNQAAFVIQTFFRRYGGLAAKKRILANTKPFCFSNQVSATSYVDTACISDISQTPIKHPAATFETAKMETVPFIESSEKHSIEKVHASIEHTPAENTVAKLDTVKDTPPNSPSTMSILISPAQSFQQSVSLEPDCKQKESDLNEFKLLFRQVASSDQCSIVNIFARKLHLESIALPDAKSEIDDSKLKSEPVCTVSDQVIPPQPIQPVTPIQAPAQLIGEFEISPEPLSKIIKDIPTSVSLPLTTTLFECLNPAVISEQIITKKLENPVESDCITTDHPLQNQLSQHDQQGHLEDFKSEYSEVFEGFDSTHTLSSNIESPSLSSSKLLDSKHQFQESYPQLPETKARYPENQTTHLHDYGSFHPTRRFSDTKDSFMNHPNGWLSPTSLSRKFEADLQLYSAIHDAHIQYTEMDKNHSVARAKIESAALAQMLTDQRKQHQLDLERARNAKHAALSTRKVVSAHHMPNTTQGNKTDVPFKPSVSPQIATQYQTYDEDSFASALSLDAPVIATKSGVPTSESVYLSEKENSESINQVIDQAVSTPKHETSISEFIEDLSSHFSVKIKTDETKDALENVASNTRHTQAANQNADVTPSWQSQFEHAILQKLDQDKVQIESLKQIILSGKLKNEPKTKSPTRKSHSKKTVKNPKSPRTASSNLKEETPFKQKHKSIQPSIDLIDDDILSASNAFSSHSTRSISEAILEDISVNASVSEIIYQDAFNSFESFHESTETGSSTPRVNKHVSAVSDLNLVSSGTVTPIPKTISSTSSLTELQLKLENITRSLDPSYLKRKEEKLSVSRTAANELIVKRKELQAWEARLKAEQDHISRTLDEAFKDIEPFKVATKSAESEGFHPVKSSARIHTVSKSENIEPALYNNISTSNSKHVSLQSKPIIVESIDKDVSHEVDTSHYDSVHEDFSVSSIYNSDFKMCIDGTSNLSIHNYSHQKEKKSPRSVVESIRTSDGISEIDEAMEEFEDYDKNDLSFEHSIQSIVSNAIDTAKKTFHLDRDASKSPVAEIKPELVKYEQDEFDSIGSTSHSVSKEIKVDMEPEPTKINIVPISKSIALVGAVKEIEPCVNNAELVAAELRISILNDQLKKKQQVLQLLSEKRENLRIKTLLETEMRLQRQIEELDTAAAAFELELNQPVEVPTNVTTSLIKTQPVLKTAVSDAIPASAATKHVHMSAEASVGGFTEKYIFSLTNPSLIQQSAAPIFAETTSLAVNLPVDVKPFNTAYSYNEDSFSDISSIHHAPSSTVLQSIPQDITTQPPILPVVEITLPNIQKSVAMPLSKPLENLNDTSSDISEDFEFEVQETLSETPLFSSVIPKSFEISAPALVSNTDASSIIDTPTPSLPNAAASSEQSKIDTQPVISTQSFYSNGSLNSIAEAETQSIVISAQTTKNDKLSIFDNLILNPVDSMPSQNDTDAIQPIFSVLKSNTNATDSTETLIKVGVVDNVDDDSSDSISEELNFEDDTASPTNAVSSDLKADLTVSAQIVMPDQEKSGFTLKISNDSIKPSAKSEPPNKLSTGSDMLVINSTSIESVDSKPEICQNHSKSIEKETPQNAPAEVDLNKLASCLNVTFEQSNTDQHSLISDSLASTKLSNLDLPLLPKKMFSDETIDFITDSIFEKLLADTISKIKTCPPHQYVSNIHSTCPPTSIIPTTVPSLKSIKKEVVFKPTSLAGIMDILVTILENLDFPLNGHGYTCAPFLHFSILDKLSYTIDNTVLEIRELVLAVANETLYNLFELHRQYDDPIRPFLKKQPLKPHAITRPALLTAVTKAVKDYVEYSDIHDENLDVLLIEEIKRNERDWLALDIPEAMIRLRLEEEIWDELIGDTVLAVGGAFG
ncbi:hypothetical protein RTP6_007326 [Batrachochytrium dendrobatidis]